MHAQQAGGLLHVPGPVQVDLHRAGQIRLGRQRRGLGGQLGGMNLPGGLSGLFRK